MSNKNKKGVCMEVSKIVFVSTNDGVCGGWERG